MQHPRITEDNSMRSTTAQTKILGDPELDDFEWVLEDTAQFTDCKTESTGGGKSAKNKADQNAHVKNSEDMKQREDTRLNFSKKERKRIKREMKDAMDGDLVPVPESALVESLCGLDRSGVFRPTLETYTYHDFQPAELKRHRRPSRERALDTEEKHSSSDDGFEDAPLFQDVFEASVHALI